MRVDTLTVYGWFRELVRSRIPSNPNIIHVTEASGCLRKAFYDRVAPAPALDVTNVVVTIGNGIHHQLQALLLRKGWEAEVSVKFRTKVIELVGHADLVAPDGTVVEIKTVNEVPQEPYQPHVMQVNAYLNMLNSREGYIVYIGRDGKVRTFMVRSSKVLFHKLLKRAHHLHYSLINNEPPKPEKSPLCSYCPYRWRCFR